VRGWPLSGAGNGVVGMQRIVPGGSSHVIRALATLYCSRGLSRSSHVARKFAHGRAELDEVAVLTVEEIIGGG
jgi:hypothetical protein